MTWASPLSELYASRPDPIRHGKYYVQPPRKRVPAKKYDRPRGGSPRRVMPPIEGALSSSQVCLKTGASLRQLQWWDEKDYLKPWRIEGHRRWYVPLQVEKISRLVQMLKAGVTLQPALKLMGVQFDSVQVVSRPTVIFGMLVVPVDKKRK